MSVTSPFPYTFKEQYETTSVTCVFKLWFGSKYFIFKGMRMDKTVETLSVQIHREMNNQKDDSILFKAVAYIKRARIVTMTVEIIYETDAILDLLTMEYEELQEAKKDPNCLNTRFTNNEYYPKWIPQHIINEFAKQLQGVRMPDKHKNLRKYLTKYIKKDSDLDQIMKYILDRFN